MRSTPPSPCVAADRADDLPERRRCSVWCSVCHGRSAGVAAQAAGPAGRAAEGGEEDGGGVGVGAAVEDLAVVDDEPVADREVDGFAAEGGCAVGFDEHNGHLERPEKA